MARRQGISNNQAAVIAADVYRYRLKYRYKWSVIARIFGYKTEAGVIKAAMKHARKNGLKWPLKRMTVQEECYQEFVRGLSWLAIAEELGLDYPCYAKKNAYRYALKEGLEWPPDSPLYERVYTDLKRGFGLSEVIQKYNLQGLNAVRLIGRTHAKKNGLEWPVG